VREWEAHDKRIWAVDFAPLDPQTFATGSDDGTVKVRTRLTGLESTVVERVGHGGRKNWQGIVTTHSQTDEQDTRYTGGPHADWACGEGASGYGSVASSWAVTVGIVWTQLCLQPGSDGQQRWGSKGEGTADWVACVEGPGGCGCVWGHVRRDDPGG
jgi:WD40 repeat protein